MENYQARFSHEVLELLEGLEGTLLQLENNPQDAESIAELFRVVHTIKGTASMFGFANMGKLTHDVEDLFQIVRTGELNVNEHIIKISFSTVDLLRSMLNSRDQLTGDLQKKFDTILHDVKQILAENNNADKTGETPEKGRLSYDQSMFYVRYQPDSDVLERGVDPLGVFEELEEEGQFLAFLDLNLIPSPEDFDAEKTFLAWDIFCSGFDDQEVLEDIFMFFLEHEYTIIPFKGGEIKEIDQFDDILKRLEQYKIDESDLFEQLDGLCNGCLYGLQEESANAQTEEDSDDRAEEPVQETLEMIRVDAGRLDELINLVSDLVTLNSQLELRAGELNDDVLQKQVSGLSKLSKSFRDNALNLRLIPVETLTIKMHRMVRDLAGNLGKKVDFITEGTNTELDKNIIRRLEGPVLHIIRNCLDHAIEMPDERIAQNKPEKGLVRFIAFYSGANVFIQIQDDGRGIDPEKVKKKAVNKGMISADENISDEQAYNLIFEPGFSTAEEVSDLSGRGVGLDSVKKQIADMRGQVDVESEINLGTSFTIKLPLTLSIIDTLMTKVGKHTLLVPMEYVVKTMFVENINKPNIAYEDSIIPLLNMGKLMEEPPSEQKMRAIIIRHYNKRYAIAVDHILRDYQAVVKPLGAYNRHHPFFSGSSIMGDGSLAVILDINRLIKYQKQNKS